MDSLWQDLIPIEIVSEILKYLPRNDRLSCYFVCRKWKEALDRKYLWERIVLHVDRDFLEPSTTLLTREYYRHIDSLEIGWQKPVTHNRWLPLKVQDLTKRAVRYLFSLIEHGVQVNSLKIFEWYDVYPFKKIIYHLGRFVKIQTKLDTLIFRNTNFPKNECFKILDACTLSKDTITRLEIRNNFYIFNTAFDTMEFVLYLKQFAFLQELKLDYFILSRPKVIDVVTENGKGQLKILEIYFDESDLHSIIIPERKWNKLKRLCPDLKVSISIRNICHYEQLEFIFLMEKMPLNSFSLIASPRYNQRFSRDFESTLRCLINNYHRTLEFIRLEIKNNRENLDDVLLALILKCPKLKKLFFDGLISDDMFLFHEIFRYKKSFKGLNVKTKPHRKKSLTNIIHLFSIDEYN
ncbi:unnamed protein product [Phaedon cochleariae]|uniref:F-box domain-containing protein n=1 Tax=Phaedon cochleariae TaxID=80249 RepID=A0A9P0GKP1_PHACE|nr:unnamed protein product [Phaedon cochleariae]